MKTVPTAEEFLLSKMSNPNLKLYVPELIEFAKLHCKAKGEAIKEKVYVIHKETPLGDEYVINEESIDDAYPEELIK